ncbi:hypothetical protein, partial [Nocardia terpenica]|uniref:hypothetical protein n=1 Tax=Nocardia terpenica TaxID=455432 RepID=UPI0039810C86
TSPRRCTFQPHDSSLDNPNHRSWQGISVHFLNHQSQHDRWIRAQQLAAGFARKADELNVVLKQFIIGAMQLQEAYLIAAGKTTEAEAKNTQVLQAIGRDLDAERPGV